MAEGHNYSLVIELRSEGNEQNPIAGQSNAPQTTPNSSDKATPQSAVKALVSFNSFVKPFVKPFVDQHIQTISMRTGAEETQQRIQFAYSIGEQAIGLGASVLTGFILGNVPGALLGASTSILTSMVNFAKAVNEIDLAQSLEAVSLRGMNVRAGGYAPSYSASRSGNQ